MTRRTPLAVLGATVAAIAAIAGAAHAQQKIEVYTSDDPALSLGRHAFPGGKTVDLRIGIGSGAFRHPKDPAYLVHMVSDRGANFTCNAEGQEITGLTPQQMCAGTRRGRIYPQPNYAPSIFTVELLPDARFRLLDIIALKDRDGRPLNGIVNPLTKATTDVPFDGRGNRLAHDPNGVDLEGIVKLANGEFWLSDESAPGLIHAAADGRVIKRLVPAGSESDFKGANYRVVGSLPAILVKRQGNRGIESVAISPDEKFLYFIVQNPLANPDAATYRDANAARLFKMELASGKVIGQYVYVMDHHDLYKDGSKAQSAVRISEMAALGTDRLLVLERTDKVTRIHEIALRGATNILGGKWDDVKTSPTLESFKDLKPTGIVPVSKALRLDTNDHKQMPVKLEGIAFMGDGRMLLVNDDDFGITGEKSQIILVSDPALRLTN